MTRTKEVPSYGPINRLCAKRAAFRGRAAWEWVRQNHPDVAVAITKEAYKRWPRPISKGRTTVDYGFLEEIEEN